MLRFKDIEGIYLIAEIGINHNGDLDIAKRLIDAVFACSWNCAKFQKRDPDLCVPERQKHVAKDTPWGKMSYLAYKKRIEFGKKEYDYIDEYSKSKPLDWTSSVWDMNSLKFMLQYKVPFLKIPSAKISDKKLVEAVAKTGIPVIASTGMSVMKEVDDLVDILKRYSCEFALMHTNSTYPTPIEDINIRCIHTLKKRYNCVVGYSGHEYNVEPTVYAAVLGAKIIERHITLNHKMWGTDQAASLEVAAMDLLRKRIRDIDLVMGDGRKRVTRGEEEIRLKLKK
ncbi:MAG: N-acetylneuraminate synthase family protein [Candidatus Omnitrophica bacterium]|nr:N-acetylneuraminate synthase family protein [Candidatus Omnitrophota bacterium]